MLCSPLTQGAVVNKDFIKEDFKEILSDIKHRYIYLSKKNVDLLCIEEQYAKKIDAIKTEDETVLFFEDILNEFYDSHIHLNKAVWGSYRLRSPNYAEHSNGKTTITSAWYSQIENLNESVVGAEILTINQQTYRQALAKFDMKCADKSDGAVQEWILNKTLAGRYGQPRVLELKLLSGKKIELDLDQLKIKKDNGMLSFHDENDVGIIRIHDSLGENSLIKEFDAALDTLMHNKRLIIDLRNTKSGGNTYVARGIMGRLISKESAYQKHSIIENYIDNMPVQRSWIEYVSPRSSQYKGEVIVLVGRWTGSMGEGIAIGFDAMQRAHIKGTKMARLAGAVENFTFKHAKFGFSLSTQKMFHVNGTPREEYVPAYDVQLANNQQGLILELALKRTVSAP